VRELKRIRKQKGVTQRELSEASGVDPATISLVETGKRQPKIETLESLARALGVEVGEFFPPGQPDLFTAAARASQDAREFEAAGGRVIALSDEDNSRLLEQVRDGDTEGIESEAFRLEEMYRRALALGTDEVITRRLMDAYVTVLAALALARGGTIEEVKTTILRAMGTRVSSHAGMASSA
jgi:transcriptional regulator with XRE-family HTH domain